MGGKQSRDTRDQSQALFTIRSGSLDSISTSVSQRTLQSSGSALTHSPSLNTIGQAAGSSKTSTTTKDEKGNTYFLLETASVGTTTENNTTLSLREEKREVNITGASTRQTKGTSDKSATHQSGGKRENVGPAGKSTRKSESVRLTSSLPADGEKCSPASVAASGTGGVSTQTATELASRKDFRPPNGNEKSKLVQRVLPTRSHSSRTAAKPAMAVVAPEQREMEREVQELLKSMLKQQHKEASEPGKTRSTKAADTAGNTTTTSPSTAQLPESLLQCSQQELNHLASYICHTIKDTLQSSLVEQALTAQQMKSATAESRAAENRPSASPTKHVQISDDPVSIRTVLDMPESPRNSGAGSGERVGSSERDGGRGAEERLRRRRHKRARRERPVSTSGVCCDEDSHVHLSDPQTTTSSPSYEAQSQTHSNEESYYHRCGSGGGGERSSDFKTTYCRACREHSRKYRSSTIDKLEPLHRAEQRRKRGGRSKDAPVDVSLDDNCPGVNLIRRKYSTHRHVVCDSCLQTVGRDVVSGRQGRRRQKQLSVEAPDSSELQLTQQDHSHEVQGVGEGSGFITLYQLRTVAQILRESSGCAEESVQKYDRARQRSFGPPKSHSFRHERSHEQCRVKPKQKSVAFDDCLSVVYPPAQPEQDLVGPSSSPEQLSNLKELAYPSKSRSGRDSPATDMAVIDLKVDSPCMLQPLEMAQPQPGPEGTMLMIHHENSPNKITHLHHHYHHIIHHGEP